MSQRHALTAGIDLGDRYTHVCLVDSENGEVIEESRIPTNTKAFQRRFSGIAPMRMAIETGTHSPWVSRLLEECGHETDMRSWSLTPVKCASSTAKGLRTNDKIDAEKLARLARVDPKLLSPIKHRGESSQAHLAIIRSRDALVSARTQLVNPGYAEQSSQLELVCLDARRKASTIGLQSTCLKSWQHRPWNRSCRPSPPSLSASETTTAPWRASPRRSTRRPSS